MRIMSDVESLAPQVIELARKAGYAILAIYAQFSNESQVAAQVEHKADGSPVTLADLTSHHIICEGLKQIVSSIPIVSEEDSDSYVQRTSSNEFWLMDPLDGTKEFLMHHGEFTVNIALIRGGKPIWGVVFAPVLDLMYWGGSGFGAYRECSGVVESISVKVPIIPGCRYRVVASKSHLNSDTREFIEKLGEIDLVQAGSSLKFCRIAEGSADLYPRLGPTCEWDTAAAQAVVEGAGGFVLGFDGKPLRYGKEDILNPYFVASSVSLTALGI